MEVKVITETKNPLLKRTEVNFLIEHQEQGNTPPRLEVRKTLASSLKANPELVFIRKVTTRTGTHTAVGIAHIYETFEQAKLIEAGYIIRRHMPPEKPKEDAKENP